MFRTATEQRITCYHCGETCPSDPVRYDLKYFCCTGCKAVYELLSRHRLSTYYQFEQSPGATASIPQDVNRFAYLDDDSVQDRILDFSDGQRTKVTFSIPQMHCASCIWLLENLHRLSDSVLAARVNFLEKRLSVTYDPGRLKLSELVDLLALIGYEPDIMLDSLDKKGVGRTDRTLYRKIGVAGFCFGNIMLFSFPDYLAPEGMLSPSFRTVFNYMALALAVPVLFYSAADYLRSAFLGLKQHQVNIDLPISIGIIMLFARSLYDILILGQQGYFDSFAGLVFFLLIGRLFQQKTYDSLAFERDYRSFFPLSVRVKKSDVTVSLPVTRLVISDRILIRNQELIPADSILISDSALIDYSFVTGESEPVLKIAGQLIYAGGRQRGNIIELEVVKETSQSYLTQLWNDNSIVNQVSASSTDNEPQSHSVTGLANQISKYFTAAVVSIAAITGIAWFLIDPTVAINAVTAVLIVACPCALALSTPFTLGTILRILGRNRLYLKNSEVIEELARIDHIIFDKTGTLTDSGNSQIVWRGEPLTMWERKLIASLVSQSLHPLSRRISDYLADEPIVEVSSLEEKPGEGIEGIIEEKLIRIGSRSWTVRDGSASPPKETLSGMTSVYVNIDRQTRGRFEIGHTYRTDADRLVHSLHSKYELSMLTGDNDRERPILQKMFSSAASLRFEQSPHDKLNYVKYLRQSGRKVLMLGDGLNDAGALAAADVGIAISENTAGFTPASDGILDAGSFILLNRMTRLAQNSLAIIKLSFGLSFFYNLVGLAFAASGALTPLVAAILMPVSSISVVLFATLASRWQARRLGLN